MMVMTLRTMVVMVATVMMVMKVMKFLSAMTCYHGGWWWLLKKEFKHQGKEWTQRPLRYLSNSKI